MERRSFKGGYAELDQDADGTVHFMCLPQGESGGYRITMPTWQGDPWEWFAEQGHLGAVPWDEETKAARDEIESLGYDLQLREHEGADGTRWQAIVVGPGDVAAGRGVARAVLRREAATKALEAVRQEVRARSE